MWRLGIDLGTNSIGYARLKLTLLKGVFHPISVEEMGVRIFSDGRNPKDGQSLAAMRRVPKGMRKTRDRAKNRNTRFLQELRRYNLLPMEGAPESPTEGDPGVLGQDPYVLRMRGLEEPLSAFELGRALWHLKRRGFKSNRKADSGDQEGGKIRDAATRTLALLEEEGVRTLGELLGRRRQAVMDENKTLPKKSRSPLPPTRTRLRGKGAKASYELYATREMVLDEFDLLWAAQKPHHPTLLTDEAFAALRETLSWQWPLKPPQVGRCMLLPDEPRAPKALPKSQRVRILQELNNLRKQIPGSEGEELTLDERNTLYRILLTQAKLAFDKMPQKLKLPRETRFNLESRTRKHLDGDLTAAKLGGSKLWGKGWRDLPLAEQETIVERLLNEESEPALIAWLSETYGLEAELATKVARANLPDGYGSLSVAALERIYPVLDEEVLPYSEAVKKAGFQHHSDFRDGVIYPEGLPYYGEILQTAVGFGSGIPEDPAEVRYGKIANPTVHVALNQIRKVVNDLIARYGPPEQIVVELARDLPMSAQGKRDLEKRQSDNRKANETRDKELAKLGLSPSYQNRLKLRLWEELNADNVMERRCVFTGEQISIERLFSAEVEIEHLLPFSRTLDDGVGNKTVSLRAANRIKANRTPYEAFSSSPEGFDWAAISARAANLPPNKSWRFGPDAMQRYDDEERDFLARQLTDTQYIARIAQEYLSKIDEEIDVWVVPGRMTADLRWALGLNSVLPGHNREDPAADKKNRNDHRHHAVDALVVALSDRSRLQEVAAAAKEQEDKQSDRLLAPMPPPWEGFRDQVKQAVSNIVVSHKPDHGVQGALHNDTAYGLIDPQANPSQKMPAVRRVPLESMSKRSDIERIRDDVLRNHFLKIADSEPDNLTAALVAAGEAMSPPVRKARIEEQISGVVIRDQQGQGYKLYKGDANYCYDIFADEKGKWTGRVISRFDANQKGFNPKSKFSTEGEPLIFRLRIDDMLELEQNGERQVMRVVKLSGAEITLAGHFEAGALKSRNEDKNDPFRYLRTGPASIQKRNAVRVTVSPSGHVTRHR